MFTSGTVTPDPRAQSGFSPRWALRQLCVRARTLPVMRERPPVYTNRLQCVECGRVSGEDERGWTARLPLDDEAVVFYGTSLGSIEHE